MKKLTIICGALVAFTAVNLLANNNERPVFGNTQISTDTIPKKDTTKDSFYLQRPAANGVAMVMDTLPKKDTTKDSLALALR